MTGPGPLVHRDDDRGIATLTLDSPHNRNALSSQLVGELRAHLSDAAADDRVRAVVLTHTGTVFCAGADLKEQVGEGGPAQGTQRMLELMRAILELPKPVIARIDGAVRAGGVGIVGACDMAVASVQATFAFTEVRLGLAPAMISLATLGRMTERGASRYYLTGETFNGIVATDIGLVTESTDDVDAATTAVCAALRLASPQGLRESKRLTTVATLSTFDARAEELQALSARLFSSDEAREGMLAFLEKRPPRWAAP